MKNPTDEQASRKAANRSKIVSLGSRGKLPADVAARVNVDDETLLDDVTRAARDSVTATTTLSAAVAAAVDADIDRDDIIAAVVAGGYALQTARNVVSSVSRTKGKSVRKSAGKRELPVFAVKAGDWMIEECSGDAYHALKMAKKAIAAIKERIAQIERAKAKVKPAKVAPVVVVPVAVAA